MTKKRFARAGWVRLLVVLAMGLPAAGCGGATTATPPPFELGDKFRHVTEGDPHTQHGPAYTLRITEPKEGMRYGQREDVNVFCEVTVPDGAAMPSRVSLNLVGGNNVIFDSVTPRPEKKQDDGAYLFAGRLTAPQKAGAFKIVAEGMDTVWLRPSGPVDEGNRPMEKRVSTRRISSPPVTVRVK